MASERQRSRKGCLTCRQKRKKCDEAKPTCARCNRASDHCVWPPPLLAPKRPGPLAQRNHQPPEAQSSPMPGRPVIYDLHGLPLLGHGATLARPVAMEQSDPLQQLRQSYIIGQSTGTPAGLWSQNPILGLPAHLADNSSVVLDPELDEDEEATFKTMEWLPATKYTIYALLLDNDSASLSNALDLYLAFFVRYSYEPTRIPRFAVSLCAHMRASTSIRLAIMSAANLFQSFFDHSKPSAIFKKRAEELIIDASAALQVELLGASPSEQLVAIGGILNYQYYSGNIMGYHRCIDQAIPAIKALIGTAPLKFRELHGTIPIEVQVFVWCDVFSSLILDRPTRLIYDCNADELLWKNQADPGAAVAPGFEPGSEWMAGLPDALLMLTIQIINLRHSQSTRAEQISQATIIEAKLRSWKVWPSRTANSMMRVQRMSAQEIWRHFVILVLYQLIHQAIPDNVVVQQSVKQIVQLASALRPGRNPDCLLYAPYFMAGTFAVSALHRHFIKTRILQCNLDSYSNMLTTALENVWKDSYTDSYCGWSSRLSPLTIML